MTNGFNRFNKNWGSNGLLDDPTDAQADAGWAYIGQAPPTVEQFNSVEQWGDDKDNWLYNQIANVILASGGTPSAADLNGLLNAIQSLGRKRIAQDLNLYVNIATGNDSNDGLTPGTAFQHIQSAWDHVVRFIDMNSHNVNINVADGTYNIPVKCYGNPLGFGTGNFVTIVGNITTPANCKIITTNDHCIMSQSGNTVILQGLYLSASGQDVGRNDACAIVCDSGSTVIINNNMEFGQCVGFHMWASIGQISIGTNYIISGGGHCHFFAGGGGSIAHGGPNPSSTVTLINTPHFDNAFTYVSDGGNISCFGPAAPAGQVIFNGAATGQKYGATRNGVIWTDGAGQNFFPGDQAGLVSYGGQYV
jgi:hypothetical protein